MSYIQGNSVGSPIPATATASYAIAFGLPNQAADTLIAFLSYAVSAGTVAVSDSQGNTWTRQSQATQSGVISEMWTAANCAASASNTVTATVSGGNFNQCALVILEYGNVQVVPIDGTPSVIGSSSGTATASTTTTVGYDVLVMFAAAQVRELTVAPWTPVPTALWNERFSQTFGRVGNMLAGQLISWDRVASAAGAQSASVTTGISTSFTGVIALKLLTPEPPTPTAATLLIINEPSIGYTDQTLRLSFEEGSETNFTLQLRQRGSARVYLRIQAGDSYLPTIGTLVYLYDQPASGTLCIFIGTIDQTTVTWDGNSGAKIVECDVTSLEQAFDAILCPPLAFFRQTTDQIAAYLLTFVCSGVPIVGKLIAPGTYVDSLIVNFDQVSDIFDQLATLSNFVWGVNPTNQGFYFAPAASLAAPFTFITTMMLWESMKYNLNRQDFRNQQGLRISFNAFGISSDTFGPNAYNYLNQDLRTIEYTLQAPPLQITQAFLTQSVQNHAVGTFSGQPSPGDTITVGLSPTPWAPSTVYGVGNSVLDTNGHQQNCLVAGTSGSSEPDWNDTGGQTPDGGTLVWQDVGSTNITYAFVAALDNTQWGQVLIGATAAQTGQNLVNAINGVFVDSATGAFVRGVVFSLPTWEHPTCNATNFNTDALNFTVFAKAAGANFTSPLSTTSSAFSWSAATTFGGSDGTTSTLSIGAPGDDATSQVQYNPGNPVINLNLNPPLGSNQRVGIGYQRVGGDVVLCEDTASVLARAAIEGGTGKYQRLASDTNILSAATALIDCQAGLAAYGVIPSQFTTDLFVPGLLPGQQITIALSDLPVGIAALVNAAYAVEELQGKLQLSIEGPARFPGGGLWRFTLDAIDVNQIGSYMDFWEDLASGGGGSQVVGAQGTISSSIGPVAAVPAGLEYMGVSGTLTPNLNAGGAPCWVHSSGTADAPSDELTGNASIAIPTSASGGQTFKIRMKQDSTGGRTVTFDAFYTEMAQWFPNTLPTTVTIFTFQINQGNTAAFLIDVIVSGASTS